MIPITFYKWLDTTALSQALQASTLAFPVTEVIHLLGLTILLGVTTVVSLRLLGYGLPQSAAAIHEGTWAWTWLGFALVMGTGIIMLIAEPIKLSTNAAFAYKLGFLAAAVALHFFGYLVLVKPGRAEAHPVASKVLALLVIVCWFGTGIAGRAIGFV